MQVNSFGQLLSTRVGFAAAQATQNPVCFSLIPELFPKSKTTAMAFYNSAIYMGRALSFAAVIVAGQLGIKHADLGVTMVCVASVASCSVWSDGEAASFASTQKNPKVACTPMCCGLQSIKACTVLLDLQAAMRLDNVHTLLLLRSAWFGPGGCIALTSYACRLPLCWLCLLECTASLHLQHAWMAQDCTCDLHMAS